MMYTTVSITNVWLVIQKTLVNYHTFYQQQMWDNPGTCIYHINRFFFHFLTSYIIYVMVWDNETNLKNYQLIIHCIISCVTATNWNFFFISLTSNVKPHFCHFRQDLRLHHWKDFNILKVCYTNDICKWFRNTVLCLQKGNNSI